MKTSYPEAETIKNGTYEAVAVRGANGITSAVVKLLELVVHDYPDATEIVTWSDSCVPQNKNFVIGCPMANLLTRHPQGRNYTEVLSPWYSIQHCISNVTQGEKKQPAPQKPYTPKTQTSAIFQSASITA